jgi:hypothetical protein
MKKEKEMSIGEVEMKSGFSNRKVSAAEMQTDKKDTKFEIGKKTNKQLISEWAEVSTIHGSSKVALKHLSFFHRMLWLLFLLGFAAYATKEIYTQFRKYLNFDVYTTIDEVRTEELRYPEVHICNLYTYRIGIYDDFLDYYEAVERVT